MPALLVLALLAEAVFHHVGLEPDDGLDAGLAALLVELDDAGEHPVVGDGQGRHAQLHRPADQVVHLAGPVERRVVGVDVQVAEARLTFRRGLCYWKDGAGAKMTNRSPAGLWSTSPDTPALDVCARCGARAGMHRYRSILPEATCPLKRPVRLTVNKIR